MHDKKKKEIIDQFVLAQRPILEIMAAGKILKWTL